MVEVALLVDRLQRQHRTGIDRYYDQLIARLPHLAPGWQFVVYSFGEAQQDLSTIAPNLRHQPIAISRRQLSLRNLLQVPYALERWVGDADLVHLMMPLPLALGGRRTLVTVHDLASLRVPSHYNRWVRLATRSTLKRLASQQPLYVNVSYSTQADLLRLFRVAPERSYAIHLGVTEQYQPLTDTRQQAAVRAKYGLPDNYFLYIGSMHPRKNLPTAVKAYHAYRQQSADPLAMVFAGRYALGELSLSNDYQSTLETLILPGYIDEADLPAVISGALALLYPSIYEGFGLPVLEAMACGTAVITARTSSITELVTAYTLLCDPHDVACFAAAMNSVQQDDRAREQQVASGLEHVKQFTWQQTAEQTLQLYREMLAADG